MRYAILTSVACLLLLSLYACSGSNRDTGKTFEPGEYTFVMTDSTGMKLTEGKIKLDTTSGGKLNGSYEFTKHYVDNFPGLSTMRGECSGTFKAATGGISLNMNPKIADANVYVGALIKRNGFAGEWSYSTFVGIKAKGGFSAVRSK